MDEKFSILPVDPNDIKKFYLEKWTDNHSKWLPKVKNSFDFVKTITFKREELLPFELDDLLEKIMAFEKPLIQSNLN